jgi:hypothetical protein
MSDSGDSVPAALSAARRLAIREAREPSSDSAAVAAALHQICWPVFASIRQSMGVDGCSALFGRAFTRTEWKHPAVRTIRGTADWDITLHALVSAVEAHGAAATASAVDAVLVALHEILGRIIGEDMSKRIIDHNAQSTSRDEAGSS